MSSSAESSSNNYSSSVHQGNGMAIIKANNYTSCHQKHGDHHNHSLITDSNKKLKKKSIHHESIVCSMCGDVGIAQFLSLCIACSRRYQHTYCSSRGYNWRNRGATGTGQRMVCDWCLQEEEKERRKSSASLSDPACTSPPNSGGGAAEPAAAAPEADPGAASPPINGGVFGSAAQPASASANGPSAAGDRDRIIGSCFQLAEGQSRKRRGVQGSNGSSTNSSKHSKAFDCLLRVIAESFEADDEEAEISAGFCSGSSDCAGLNGNGDGAARNHVRDSVVVSKRTAETERTMAAAGDLQAGKMISEDNGRRPATNTVVVQKAGASSLQIKAKTATNGDVLVQRQVQKRVKCATSAASGGIKVKRNDKNSNNDDRVPPPIKIPNKDANYTNCSDVNLKQPSSPMKIHCSNHNNSSCIHSSSSSNNQNSVESAGELMRRPPPPTLFIKPSAPSIGRAAPLIKPPAPSVARATLIKPSAPVTGNDKARIQGNYPIQYDQKYVQRKLCLSTPAPLISPKANRVTPPTKADSTAESTAKVIKNRDNSNGGQNGSAIATPESDRITTVTIPITIKKDNESRSAIRLSAATAGLIDGNESTDRLLVQSNTATVNANHNSNHTGAFGHVPKRQRCGLNLIRANQSSNREIGTSIRENNSRITIDENVNHQMVDDLKCRKKGSHLSPSAVVPRSNYRRYKLLADVLC